MFDFHGRNITADMDAAEELLEQDRSTVEFEKTYDDERQKQALAVMNQSMNSIALVTSQSITIDVHTAQSFVSYFFIFCVVIFTTNILKNTLFVYKKEVTRRLGEVVYDVSFQYLSILGLFFFYLLFALVRSYFEIDQRLIPFISAALALYILCVSMWNKDTQTKKIA